MWECVQLDCKFKIVLWISFWLISDAHLLVWKISFPNKWPCMYLSPRNRWHKCSWKERWWHAVSARRERYGADFVLLGYSFTRWEHRACKSLLVCLTALIPVAETDLWTVSFLQRVARQAGRCAWFVSFACSIPLRCPAAQYPVQWPQDWTPSKCCENDFTGRHQAVIFLMK